MGKFFEHMDFMNQMEFPFHLYSFQNDFDDNFEDLEETYPPLPQPKYQNDQVLTIQKNLRRISGEFDFNYDLPSEIETSKKERPPLSRVSSTGSISNYVYRPPLPRSLSSTDVEERTQVQDGMLSRYDARQKQFEDAVQRQKSKEERKRSFSGLSSASKRSISDFARSLSGSLSEFARSVSEPLDPEPASADTTNATTSDENTTTESISSKSTAPSSVPTTPKLTDAPTRIEKHEKSKKPIKCETSSETYETPETPAIKKPPPLPPKDKELATNCVIPDIPKAHDTEDIPLTTTRSRRLTLSNVGKKMRRKSFSEFGRSIAKKVVSLTTLETTPYNSDDEVFDEDKGEDLPEVEMQLIHNSLVPAHKRKKIQLPTLDPTVISDTRQNNNDLKNNKRYSLPDFGLIDIPPPCKLERNPSSEIRLINQAVSHPNPSLLSPSTISKYSLSSNSNSTSVLSKSTMSTATLASSTSAATTVSSLSSLNGGASTLDPKARLQLMKKQKQKQNQLIQNSNQNSKKSSRKLSYTDSISSANSSSSLTLVAPTPKSHLSTLVDPSKLYYIPPLNPVYQPSVPVSVRSSAIKYDFARLSPIPSISTDQSSIKSFNLLNSVETIKEESDVSSTISRGGKTSASPLPQLPFDVLIAQSAARRMLPSNSSSSTIKSVSTKTSVASDNSISSSSNTSSSKSSTTTHPNNSSVSSSHHSASSSSPSFNSLAALKSSDSLSVQSSPYQTIKPLSLCSSKITEVPSTPSLCLSPTPSLTPIKASSPTPTPDPVSIPIPPHQEVEIQQQRSSSDQCISRLNSLSLKRRPPPVTSASSPNREVSSYSCSSLTAPSSRASSAVTVIRRPPPDSDISPINSIRRSLPPPTSRITSTASTLKPATPTTLNPLGKSVTDSKLSEPLSYDYTDEFLDIYSGFGDIEENDDIEVIRRIPSETPISQKQFDVHDLLEEYNLFDSVPVDSRSATRSSSLRRKPPPPSNDYLYQPTPTHSNSIAGSVVCHIIGCYSENNYDDPLLKEDEEDDVSLLVEFGRSIPRRESPDKSNKSDKSSSLFSYHESDTHSTDARTSIGSEYIGNFATGSNSSILSLGDSLTDDIIPLVTTKYNSSKSIPGLSYQQINTPQRATTIGLVSLPAASLSKQQKNDLYELKQHYKQKQQKQDSINDSIYDMYSDLSYDSLETDSSKETISSTKKFLQQERLRRKSTKKRNHSKHLYNVSSISSKDFKRYGYSTCNNKRFNAVEDDLEARRRSRMKVDDIESDLDDKRQERLQQLQKQREEEEEIELLELEVAKRKKQLKMRLAEQQREKKDKIELLEMTKRQLSAAKQPEHRKLQHQFQYFDASSTKDETDIQLERVRAARKRLSEGIESRKSIYDEPPPSPNDLSRRKSTRRKLAEQRHRTVSMEYLKRVGIQPVMLTGYQASSTNASSESIRSSFANKFSDSSD